MKIATWNVNSLRVRLQQVMDWLGTHQPDVLCLQETKLQDEIFPIDVMTQAGYQPIFTGQKAYNGVALLGKNNGTDIHTALPDFDDPQKRLIAATYGDLRVICVYVPNGERVGSEKYTYKLEWLTKLNAFLQQEQKRYRNIAVLGDFNIAPADRDVYDPQAWQGKILCSEAERQAFQQLLETGFVDSFHLFEQPEKVYTWWDYRMMAFRRNRGLRIDHILLSHEIAASCIDWQVDKEFRKLERPSDHAPVWVELTSTM